MKIKEEMDQHDSREGSTDIDWTSSDEEEIRTSSPIVARRPGKEVMTENGEISSVNGVPYSEFVRGFLDMNFPEELVLQVIKENGEEDQNLILSVLLSYSASENSPEDLNELPQPSLSDHQEHLSVSPDPSSSDYNENFVEDLLDVDDWSSEYEIEEDNSNSNSERRNMLLSKARTGTLSENEKTLLALVEMGYTIEEASIATERCGPEATISVLTDYIFTAQIAREQDCYLLEDTPRPRHSNGTGKIKKRKLNEMSKKKNLEEEEFIRLPNPMIGYGVPTMSSEQIRRPIPEAAKGPPFFYYENVALAPKGVWDTISRFLYEIEPEFVDSKYFSATARKRGYIHNLPIENRFPLVPLPPMNIFQAFPLSKRFWPSWDPRDKMNCIQTALGSAKLSERIRTELEKYNDTVPPSHVQKWILYECRKWNLIWTGKNKVAPLEPDEMEMLLGFPKNHTRGGGISRTDRVKSLGNSFQVDTVAYHLSVLKKLFPNGMNVLTLFSGIGGGEVALNRLGITLKYVVSVEKSKMNRDIVKSWWEQIPDEKRGILIDFEDVQKVDDEVLEKLIDTIGGFDLIIGGSPCNNLAGSNRVSRDGLEGKESSLFFEYFRILDTVRTIMRRRRLDSE